ncbi:BlaI/MecI/CopY family transcriptional regulator [Yinghuangia sp. ASG 101]|uniref:BlaI/MecI/CopY family transcriptional regulator n=1 Tax=Yinghuangia sp. ASG 101 TaxID=2896848 RepID=UPI001E2C8AAF|nr:BlaI/MecI/CopY family transcriptional regulator [Yinghuangia sp. ASG 101]UGQ11881.1 BlaI/MecI/CopY family transcriptional regulator [Yinghuangia sp. ASG 101]
MAQDRPQNTELTTQYATQVADDLARNAQEQNRVNTELVALQEQLESLREDRTVLVAIRDTLVGPSPAADRAKPASAAATATGTRKRKAPKAEKAAPGAAKSQAPKGPAPRTDAPQGPAQPTLGALIREHLGSQGAEPRSIAEIAEALGASHPDRGVKTTVVRTTIEGLVAKGLVQRHKQGGSVFYTTATTTAPAVTVAPPAEHPTPAEQPEPPADSTPEPDTQAEEPATPVATAAPSTESP